jgi:hypothetical protein
MGLRSIGALAATFIVIGCGDNIKPEPDNDSSATLELDTSAPMQIAAGDTLDVVCTLKENDITKMVSASVRVVNETSVVRMGSTIIGAKVGTIQVACDLPERGVIDATPAIVEIVHGPPANLVATMTPDPVVAGNSATGTCTVYDAYGNLIEDSDVPELQLSPTDPGNTISGYDAFLTHAGHYTARCFLPGTTSNLVGFDVVPNLPANIVLGQFPDLPIYALGNVVEITQLVTDRYGNEIVPADVTRTVTPITGTGPVVDLGNAQFRFDGEGRFRFTVTVVPPTEGGVTVSASLELLVNSRGPAITCNGDATMMNVTPGTTMTVNGSVNDVNGVASLSINGSPATFAQDGSFSTQITTRFGMNFVDISATDAFGEPTTKVCTFLISDRYADPATPIPDTVSLKLTQSAVDDNYRPEALDSLGDILYAILNSQGLSDTIHNALLAANPLKPMSCDYEVCYFIGCSCVFRSRVDYLDRSLPGPNTVSLSLVTDGIRAYVRIPNVGIKLHISGTYDKTGWVDVSYIDVYMTLDTYMSGGKPRMTVRPGSVTTNVGTITTRFSGVDGWLIDNVLVPLAQGWLRDKLEEVVTNFVTNNLSAALDSVMDGLDISSLGTTFNVPKLDGSGTIAMNFGVAFTSLNTTTSRMLFGIGTKFSAPPANAFGTLGVALPPGSNLADPTLSGQNTAVAAHVGIFNGALHALWRANLFSATIDGSTLGGGGSSGDTTLSITTRLPPVAVISSGGVVQLHLGALDLVLNNPVLPPDLSVRLGADAHASVSLIGNDLVFGSIVIDTLHVSTDSVNLSAEEQQELQTNLIALVQKLIDSSLNGALPALPIPSFTLPNSLNVYGLPGGSQLGVKSPSLSIAPQHFTLRGQFGVTP